MGSSFSHQVEGEHKNTKSTETQPNIPKKSRLLQILYSKHYIDRNFLNHIEQIIEDSSVLSSKSRSVQLMINAYVNDINRSFNLNYIIPKVIVSICSKYYFQSIYPLRTEEEDDDDHNKNNYVSHIVRTIQSSDDMIGIATNASQYNWREKLICNKLSGMIVIDVVDDIEIKWKSILCENNGNIFIRCNNLNLDSTEIRTRKQINADHNINRYGLKSELEAIKRKERKKNPNIFGNVILIVKGLLSIENSSIFTGFLYIECGGMLIDRYSNSYFISSRENSILKVNGQNIRGHSVRLCRNLS